MFTFRLSLVGFMLYAHSVCVAQVVPDNFECGKSYCTYELVSIGEQISCEVHRRLVSNMGQRRFKINSSVEVKHKGGVDDMIQIDLVSNDLFTGLTQPDFSSDLGFNKSMLPGYRASAKANTGYQMTVTIYHYSAAVWIEVEYVDRRQGTSQLIFSQPYPIAVPKRYTKGKRS